MASPIEDYAILSDCRTAALVSAGGSIDWLCLPRYDSASVLGALLGDESHGRWMLRPTDPGATAERHYDGDGFVLRTRWKTSGGSAEVLDFTPQRGARSPVVRRIRGPRGSAEA